MTPTPWRTQGWVPTWTYIPVHDARHNLVAVMYPDTGHNYTRDEVEANAADLVRAVNSHAELVKALQAARFQLVTLGGDSRIAVVGGSDEIQAAVLDMIDTALKSAGALT